MNKNRTELENAQPSAQNDQAQAPPAPQDNEISPAPAGGCLPRPCSALSDSFLESVWGEIPESCKTPDGRLKMKINQNLPMIVKAPDGHLVQLSPDNWKTLVPEAEIEFYQGEVSQETVRQIWDTAKKHHHLSSESENAM